jgi:uncharacterized protein (TIGR02391 family)
MQLFIAINFSGAIVSWECEVMVISKALDERQLKAICSVLGETKQGLTKTEIKRLLGECGIAAVDDGSRTYGNGFAYQFGSNKRDWLYNCFADDCNKTRSTKKVFSFIERALNPVSFTGEDSRMQYEYFMAELNKILILIGLEVDRTGRLKEVVRATTLNEVDKRVDSLRQRLYHRAIHHEATKYCIQDYLRKDYYDAVFEATKGLAERVRQLSGLTEDGGRLFQKAFSSKDPYVFINSMKTEHEKNEFIGLGKLLEAITNLLRNPAAHTPKINWKTDETKALDALTLISIAHKYLDECRQIPGKAMPTL